MAGKGLFDIIGPVMIGPSSSHTAGALRIGRVARQVLDEKPVRACITLYGSFARTYKGHGTDRALVAGLLGMDTDDERIRDALGTAVTEGLGAEFGFSGSGNVHPNTADIEVTGVSGKSVFIRGSSVGGGNIVIYAVNRFTVNIQGTYPALLVEHDDKPGVTGRVTTVLGWSGINIAHMHMAREQRGAQKLMVIETDENVPDKILAQIADLQHIIEVVKIDSV